MRKKPDVKGTRAVHTYAYLYFAADWALEKAEQTEDGSLFSSMFAILGAVHAVEAYMNHLGQPLFPDWDTRHHRRPKDKFAALRKHYNLNKTDFEPSYQTYLVGLQIRDQLVHGRTEQLAGEWSSELPEHRTLDVLKANWEERCNPKWARKILKACEALMSVLGRAAGHRDKPFLDFGIASAESRILLRRKAR
jgi:hypothetical protein